MNKTNKIKITQHKAEKKMYLYWQKNETDIWRRITLVTRSN